MKPNFFNDNRNRAFPFLKNTVGNRTPSTGSVTMRELPNDFIVDCGFVLGVSSGFVIDQHNIYLSRIYRQDNLVYFEFASDCPALFEVPLTFVRDVTEAIYASEHLEWPDSPGDSESDSAGALCHEPLWSGYLVTGNMESVANRLADNEEIVREAGDAIVEPALLQNLANCLLSSIELANDDRTRALSPTGCPDIEWPYEVGVLFVGARCIQGDIQWKPGYNCLITQNSTENSITIGAAQGAGAGEPCEELTLFDAETSQVGGTNDLLSGGPLCNETLRSINGIGGPLFTIIGGTGVSVIPDPENNRITIDVNMIDLAIGWSDMSTISESV